MLALDIKVVSKGLPNIGRKGMNAAYKAAYARLGHFWHEHLLPKHFTIAGAAEYNYRPRKPPDPRYKRRRPRDPRPLVESGDLQRQVRRERRVSSTSKGVKVRMRTPPYAKVHNVAPEITKVSRGDKKIMAEKLREFLVEEIEKAAQAAPRRRSGSR